jgi:hypothetical protein
MLSGRVGDPLTFSPYFVTHSTIQEAFKTNTVSSDDPAWLCHLTEHIQREELVMVESPLMTKEAMDLVSQVRLSPP